MSALWYIALRGSEPKSALLEVRKVAFDKHLILLEVIQKGVPEVVLVGSGKCIEPEAYS